MEDFESYITPREAASRLNRTEDEIWRMLETGKLPAILRAELQSKDGSSLGFDYALLPPEGVARVLHQGGSDLVLKWKYAFGNGAATCVSAKPESIRILWEPHLLSDVLGSNVEPGQAAPAGKRWTDEAKAELAAYRAQHGTKKAAEHFGISEALIRRLLPREKKTTTTLFSGLGSRAR